MLNQEDAIRQDLVLVPDKRGSWFKTVFVFECTGCSKELMYSKSELKIRTGRCVKCSKRNNHPFQTLYNCMVSSVDRTNLKRKIKVEFGLSFDDFLLFTQIGTCTYCGNRVEWKEYSSGPYNLDRRDSQKGYTMDNLTVCCSECNFRKNNFYDDEEFKAICELLRIWRSSNKQERDELMYTLVSWRDEISYTASAP